jgi:hypothetical protein
MSDMLMGVEHQRFYVYEPASNEVIGPLAFDELGHYHEEALVCVYGGEEWWPLRRWRPDGTLTVTPYEHYDAWLNVLLISAVVPWVWADLMCVEFWYGWAFLLSVCLAARACCKREFPRFPRRDQSTKHAGESAVNTLN